MSFAPPAPRVSAGPAPFVLFRSSGAVGFHKPKQIPRLVSLRCFASPDGLAPLAAEPFALCKLSAWSPCGPRNPPVSSAAPGATIGVSLRGPRSPSVSSGILFCHSRTRLRGHRLRRESGGSVSFTQCGFAFYVCSRRTMSFRRSRVAATRNLFTD